MYVGVPPTQGITVVANWSWLYFNRDLGLFVFTPQNPDPTIHTEPIIGFEKYTWEPNAVQGTLAGAPYASLRHEGSNFDMIPMEAITIGKKPGYNYPYYPGDYWVLLQDSYATSGLSLNEANPLIRIWNGGALKATWWGMSSNDCLVGSQTAWLAGRIYKSGTTTAYEEKTPFFCRWNSAAWPYTP